MRFPKVHGSNLLRQEIWLPDDLEGDLNLLFIPFQQWQQLEVNSWVPVASRLEQANSAFRFYELPTIQHRNIFSQTFINEGMRAGIPDPAARARTITLYLNKSEFKDALEIRDEDHIYILLTDRDGGVLWRTRGGCTPEQEIAFERATQQFQRLQKAIEYPYFINH